MTTRHALFLLLVVGAVWGWVAFATPTSPAYADEPDLRVTPTAAPLPEGAKINPAPDPANPDAQFPDLVVTAIRVFPSAPKVNRPVTIEVDIANIGPVPVTTGNNFFVDLYVNPQTAPQACVPGQAYWSVQAFQLDDGTETLRATFDPLTDEGFERFQDVGNVRLWAQVDTLFDKVSNRCGNVVETREDNNLNFQDVTVETRFTQLQTAPEQFLEGFSSALDLTHPLGILQNGTGWFEEPRFPQPEDADWPVNPDEPWNSPTFYNPDRHIVADNLPDTYPTSSLPQWNPPDQENVDVEIGFDPNTLYATWEDARNGNLSDRDIYFSYSLDRGQTWLEPIRINQDGAGSNQLRPQLAIDRPGQRLFIFWEDNRLGDYDIFYARSTDFGFTWEEPEYANGDPVNPINDKNVNPTAEQRNVSAATWHNDQNNETYLYVAWEDYRNGNADIFFDFSDDSGDTWLKTADSDPTTVDGNIHVQPDPTTNAGVYDQQQPNLFLDSDRLNSSAVNYCITIIASVIYYDVNGEPVYTDYHFYPESPLPRVFLTWQDSRDSVAGDPYSIYYTRGEFNYDHPDLGEDPLPEPADCAGGPRAATPRSNLPAYRFEDDHVRVDRGPIGSAQTNPVGGFDANGFLSEAFDQSYTDDSNPDDPIVYTYVCESRWRTDELIISWEDDRNGTKDIYAANIFDDISLFIAFAFVDTFETTGPPPGVSATTACLGEQQGGIGDALAPLSLPSEFRVARNLEVFSPQPYEFYELSIPEQDLMVSNGLTFSPKPQCYAPNEPPVFSSEPSDQTTPDMEVLPTPPDRILEDKDFEEQTFLVKLGWGAWADQRNRDSFNEDIFLRPIVREDITRTLTINFEERMTPQLPAFEFDGRDEIALQTVQDNIKNQIVLRRPGIQENFDPPNAQQANPSVSFALFGDPNNLENYAFYVGWDDNRNANPLLGYEGNKDVFAARLQLGDTLENGDLRPTRTGTYISPVLGNGALATWYDIKWWGDISADGVISLQTRFGLDPDSPEPPQENVVGNGWTQWTGVGGTGGFYTAPGQHITGPDGSFFPKSYYVQYRVNFNPAGGGQQGIHCLSEIDLNYELDFGPVYLPNLSRGRTIAD